MNQLQNIKVVLKTGWGIALIAYQHHSKKWLTSFPSMSREERFILYMNTQGHVAWKLEHRQKHPVKRKIKSDRTLNKHTVARRWLNQITHTSHFKASIMRQVMKSVKQFVDHLTLRPNMVEKLKEDINLHHSRMPDRICPPVIKEIIERNINHRDRFVWVVSFPPLSSNRSIILYDMNSFKSKDVHSHSLEQWFNNCLVPGLIS